MGRQALARKKCAADYAQPSTAEGETSRIRGLPPNGAPRKEGKPALARKNAPPSMLSPARQRARPPVSVDCPQATARRKRGSRRLPGKCAAEYAQPSTAEGEASPHPWTALKRRPEESGEAGACPEKMRRRAPRPEPCAPPSMFSPARQRARPHGVRGLPLPSGGQRKAGKLALARKKCAATRRGPPSRVRRRVCSAPHGRGRDLPASVDCPQTAPRGKRGSRRLPGKNAPPRAEAPEPCAPPSMSAPLG